MNVQFIINGKEVKDIDADNGAYATSGHGILEVAMSFSGGPCFIPNVRINGRSWYTNKVLSGYAGSTTASRQTFMSGNATAGACGFLKSDLLRKAAKELNIVELDSLILKGDSITDKMSGKSIKLATLGKSFTSEYRAFPP